MTRTRFVITLCLTLLAVGAVADLVAGGRRRRAHRELGRRLETWEGEGGALVPESGAVADP